MCAFLNQLDASEKTCSVEYGLMISGEAINISDSANTTTNNSVSLELRLDNTVSNYPFIVTASNDTYTVVVEGSIGKLKSDGVCPSLLHYSAPNSCCTR